MAVQTRPGLLELLHPLREGLILEHVGVTALLAKVDGERVAGPERLEPRVFLET